MTPNRLSKPLSSDEVRAARFSNRRRGYDVDEVLLFLNKVANDVQASDAERAALRADLHTVRAELQQLREQKSQPGQERVEISVHAVGLLSQAQQTADSCVAEAEQYARELIEAARNQYRDILERAQQAAAESVRGIDLTPGDNGVSVPEIEYVRTYARVAQVQLRSVLDALTHEVDRLGQVPQLDEHPPASVPGSASVSGEVSWEPTNLVSIDANRMATQGAELNRSYGGY